MPTIWEYAEHVAADDTSHWQAATRRAAHLIAHHHPHVDLHSRIPLTQILLQTTALLTYALTRSNGDDPLTASAVAVHAWAAEHAVPEPPEPDGPMDSAQWETTIRRWQHAMGAAVDRQRRELALLLEQAGHDVPPPGFHALDRYSPDPVVLVWLDLADTDAPQTPAQYGTFDQYPGPRLSLGLAALADIC